jgi:hypothetical protein
VTMTTWWYLESETTVRIGNDRFYAAQFISIALR